MNIYIVSRHETLCQPACQLAFSHMPWSRTAVYSLIICENMRVLPYANSRYISIIPNSYDLVMNIR